MPTMGERRDGGEECRVSDGREWPTMGGGETEGRSVELVMGGRVPTMGERRDGGEECRVSDGEGECRQWGGGGKRRRGGVYS